jgi:hypothetical protein
MGVLNRREPPQTVGSALEFLNKSRWHGRFYRYGLFSSFHNCVTVTLKRYSNQEVLHFYCNPVMLHSGKERMSQEETEKLMAELKTWADAEYGRRAKVARMLGVPRQRVTNWIASQGTPTLEQGLRLQAFLKKQRRRSSRP